MRKVIILINAKLGLSPAAFRDYYESNHAPLAMRMFPMVKEYRRNYIDRSAWMTRCSDVATPDADVITEMWFETEADYQAFWERASRPEIQAEIFADEVNFLDPDTVRMVLVEEYRTEL